MSTSGAMLHEHIGLGVHVQAGAAAEGHLLRLQDACQGRGTPSAQGSTASQPTIHRHHLCCSTWSLALRPVMHVALARPEAQHHHSLLALPVEV